MGAVPKSTIGFYQCSKSIVFQVYMLWNWHVFPVNSNSMEIVVFVQVYSCFGGDGIVVLLTQVYLDIMLHPSNRYWLNICLEKLSYQALEFPNDLDHIFALKQFIHFQSPYNLLFNDESSYTSAFQLTFYVGFSSCLMQLATVSYGCIL